MSDKTPWTVTVANLVLVLMGAAMIIAGAIYAIAAQAAAAGTCLSGGVVLLLFGTIDRFELIKAWSIEARVRKLDATIHDAKEMLERLREVAETFGAATIRLVNRSTPSLEQAYVLTKQSRDLMARLGSDQASIREMLLPWVIQTGEDGIRFVVSEYVHWIGEHRRKLAEMIRPSRLGGHGDRSKEHPVEFEVLQKMEEPGFALYSRISRKPLLEQWAIITDEPDRWPFLPKDGREALRARIAEWDPEIRHLLDEADLLTPSKWFRIPQ